MKVTPVGKKFGKYAPGDSFEFPDKFAKAFIKIGKLSAVTANAPTYQTRMLQAAPVASVMVAEQPEVDSAGTEWNASLHVATKLKNTDGTWRKRPGARPAEQ